MKNKENKDNIQNYCLAHLDGMLEDSRKRIHHFVAIMNDFKDKQDLIDIMNNFVHSSKDKNARDMASRVLSLMIEATKYDKCHKQAGEFL